MPIALGIVEDYVSGMTATRYVRGMSAVNFRPLHLLKHPIGSRYNISLLECRAREKR